MMGWMIWTSGVGLAAQLAAPLDDAGGEDPGYGIDLAGALRLFEYPVGGAGVVAFLGEPAQPLEVEVARVGDCSIYTHAGEDPCARTCSYGRCNPGECQHAEHLTSGDIHVDGLNHSLEVVDSELGYLVAPAPASDLFDDDAVVTATSDGGDVEPFTVSARGVAPLEVEASSWALVDGEDFPVSWTASDDAAARIQIALRVGWLGVPYQMMLLCETADDGDLTIPGALIAQLPPVGGPPYYPHPSAITRFTRSVVTTSAGPFELLVGSLVGVDWSHEP
jgi:hypothetical protein